MWELLGSFSQTPILLLGRKEQNRINKRAAERLFRGTQQRSKQQWDEEEKDSCAKVEKKPKPPKTD